jgi:hypothetical protein
MIRDNTKTVAIFHYIAAHPRQTEYEIRTGMNDTIRNSSLLRDLWKGGHILREKEPRPTFNGKGTRRMYVFWVPEQPKEIGPQLSIDLVEPDPVVDQPLAHNPSEIKPIETKLDELSGIDIKSMTVRQVRGLWEKLRGLFKD